MNDQNELGTRRLFVWRGPDDTKRLADAVAEACVTELFNINGNLVWVSEGKPVPVNKSVLHEVITRHIAGVRLVDRGDFGWQTEFFNFGFSQGADTSREPDQKVLLNLIELLVDRVAKGPSEPRALTEQQQREIRARRREGEPEDSVARSYNVDVEQVRQLAR